MLVDGCVFLKLNIKKERVLTGHSPSKDFFEIMEVENKLDKNQLFQALIHNVIINDLKMQFLYLYYCISISCKIHKILTLKLVENFNKKN